MRLIVTACVWGEDATNSVGNRKGGLKVPILCPRDLSVAKPPSLPLFLPPIISTPTPLSCGHERKLGSNLSQRGSSITFPSFILIKHQQLPIAHEPPPPYSVT